MLIICVRDDCLDGTPRPHILCNLLRILGTKAVDRVNKPLVLIVRPVPRLSIAQKQRQPKEITRPQIIKPSQTYHINPFKPVCQYIMQSVASPDCHFVL